MRQITRDAAVAFRDSVHFSRDNTRVSVSPSGNLAIFYLHDNPIARRLKSGQVQIQTAGWDTTTTKERINGLLSILGSDLTVYHKRHDLYLGLNKWDGNWITI